MPAVHQYVRLASLVIAVGAGGQDHPGLAMAMLAIGVPHGAADHLLFISGSNSGNRSWWRFATFYTLIVGAYALLWKTVPLLSFSLFIVISVYHFGQLFGGGGLRELLWGAFCLGFPVLFHIDAAWPIITGMLPNLPARAPAWMPWLGIMLALTCGGSVLRDGNWKQLGDFLVLLTVYLCTGLLLGFATFFLLWHSLPASIDQYRYFGDRLSGKEVTAALRWSLPLALIGIAFYGLVYLGLFGNGSAVPLLSQLFILVSLITLPHAVLVDRIYQR